MPDATEFNMWQTFWITFVAASVPILIAALLSRFIERKPRVCFVRGQRHDFHEEKFNYLQTFLIVANRGTQPATSLCVNLPRKPHKWKTGVHCDLNENADGTVTVKLASLAPNARVSLSFVTVIPPLGKTPQFKDGFAESVTFTEGTAEEVEAIPKQEHPPGFWLFLAACGGAILALILQGVLSGAVSV